MSVVLASVEEADGGHRERPLNVTRGWAGFGHHSLIGRRTTVLIQHLDHERAGGLKVDVAFTALRVHETVSIVT